MKKRSKMKGYSPIYGVLAAGCALGMALPPRAGAVSDEDFNSVSNLVQQLNQKVQNLEQTHQQDQKTHSQDQQQIQQLQQQLGQTQISVTNAVNKANAVAQAQEANSGPSATHNFMMVGDAEVQFGKVDGSHPAFALADFAPIFLYRASDNVLFEAGFDAALSNNRPDSTDPGASSSFDLSFAQLDYLYNDYVTVVAGYTILPLGTYTERSAGWLNKIPDDPLSRDILPETGAGVHLRGAIPIGQSGQMFTYDVYGVNGPSSSDGTANASALDLGGNVGIGSDGSYGNLHSSPSGGGRLGWFYAVKPHYDLELGVSGQSGTWDDADKYLWSAVVMDASLHISPYFEAKGEYMNTWVETADMGTIQPSGWWVQAGYKLAAFNLDLPMINNVELMGRYDTINDGQGTNTDRYTVGYVYYFTNTLLFEGDYEFLNSNDPTHNHNDYVFQLSYGF